MCFGTFPAGAAEAAAATPRARMSAREARAVVRWLFMRPGRAPERGTLTHRRLSGGVPTLGRMTEHGRGLTRKESLLRFAGAAAVVGAGGAWKLASAQAAGSGTDAVSRGL